MNRIIIEFLIKVAIQICLIAVEDLLQFFFAAIRHSNKNQAQRVNLPMDDATFPTNEGGKEQLQIVEPTVKTISDELPDKRRE